MNWTSWAIALAAWPLVGVGVAFLIGGFIHGVEAAQDPDDLTLPVLSYLRLNKRARTSRLRTPAQTGAQQDVTSGRRTH
ncbi:MAG TPA: hypothetical protein VI363_02405 [Burkholderiales bacterium]